MINDTEIAVQFQDVAFRAGGKDILSNLNLTIVKGEVLILLGRSGSGKTTTMKLINHLLMPTSGEVRVWGKSTLEWDAIELRRHIGYAIQEIGLFPHFTVEENIGLVPSLEKWKPNKTRSRVCELLELVGLNPEQFLKRYPHELSGGQRQRIGVARSLAADPPILLMDEPFGALDPITRLELQQEFRSLQKQLDKTVVFVTHDISEAFVLGDRIGLMHAGNLAEVATPPEFLRSTDPEARSFLRCLEAIENVRP